MAHFLRRQRLSQTIFSLQTVSAMPFVQTSAFFSCQNSDLFFNKNFRIQWNWKSFVMQAKIITNLFQNILTGWESVLSSNEWRVRDMVINIANKAQVAHLMASTHKSVYPLDVKLFSKQTADRLSIYQNPSLLLNGKKVRPKVLTVLQ